PIYCRYGHEAKLSTLMGVMQALISFINDKDDDLRSIDAGMRRIVVFSTEYLRVVGVGLIDQPVASIFRELQYLYWQILSIITLRQITAIFTSRPSYDLRMLMGGLYSEI